MPFALRPIATGLPFAVAAAIMPVLVFFAPRSPTAIIIAVAVTGLAIAWWRRESPAAMDRGLAAILVALWAWAAVSVVWAPDLFFAGRGILKLAGNMLLGMLVLALARRLDAATCRLAGRALVGGFLAAIALLCVEVAFDAPIKRLLWGGLSAGGDFRDRLWLYGFFWANACASVLTVFVWPVAPFSPPWCS